jgi:hypothetical protein
VLETGLVVGLDGSAIFWHAPDGRTGVSLPDSRKLWEVIWKYRDITAGFAHSHPGSGTPGPSWEDLTTFAAVELGLGRRLRWWITSSDQMIECNWSGPGKHDYMIHMIDPEPDWAKELRNCSGSL